MQQNNLYTIIYLFGEFLKDEPGDFFEDELPDFLDDELPDFLRKRGLTGGCNTTGLYMQDWYYFLAVSRSFQAFSGPKIIPRA
ncbi:hypothetical protein [Butyrivibrio sp. FCS014]|uniref:hypothetical protein n=1 Tax=Butyrivibrio sp. FCS014 TaxID=1408304 RepID=UPI00046474A4|nr:hypothetical protein [Butyrivibrio sp. FCS014]